MYKMVLKSRVRRTKSKVNTIYTSVFSKPDVINELEILHEEYVLIPGDIACNNIVFLCKAHYYNCILNELGINWTFCNPTYTPTAYSKDEILQNHRSVLDTFNIPVNGMDRYELPYLYRIPKLHKNFTKKYI
jgi:hypothetical protein